MREEDHNLADAVAYLRSAINVSLPASIERRLASGARTGWVLSVRAGRNNALDEALRKAVWVHYFASPGTRVFLLTLSATELTALLRRVAVNFVSPASQRTRWVLAVADQRAFLRRLDAQQRARPRIFNAPCSDSPETGGPSGADDGWVKPIGLGNLLASVNARGLHTLLSTDGCVDAAPDLDEWSAQRGAGSRSELKR